MSVWRKASADLLHGKNPLVPIGEEDGWDLKLFWLCGGSEEENFLYFWKLTPTLMSFSHHPSLASHPAVRINTYVHKLKIHVHKISSLSKLQEVNYNFCNL